MKECTYRDFAFKAIMSDQTSPNKIALVVSRSVFKDMPKLNYGTLTVGSYTLEMARFTYTERAMVHIEFYGRPADDN